MMTDNIHTAIETVRQEGRVDLLDRFHVADRCRKLGYADAADWVSSNPRAYARFLIENMVVCSMAWNRVPNGKRV